MNILVTGAQGFVGRNLVANLNNIRHAFFFCPTGGPPTEKFLSLLKILRNSVILDTEKVCKKVRLPWEKSQTSGPAMRYSTL